MATLTNTSIKDRYKSLLKLNGTANDELHATTLKIIEDGNGNDSCIQLAKNRLEIVPVANHANAFEVSQADGAQIFNIASDTPALTINAATVTLTQDTNFITSGGTNGMSIDGTTFSIDGSNNRVGIGTNSPNSDLSINNATGGMISLNRDDTEITNGNTLGQILFGGDDPVDGTFANGCVILASSVGAWDTDEYGAELIFKTTLTGTNSLTEKMRISDDGKVGIGTTSPDKNLHVSSSIGAQVMFSREDNTIVADEELGRLCFGGDDPSDGTYQQGAFIKGVADGEWGTGGSSTDCPARLEFATVADGTSSLDIAMTIDSDGNVGIGDTNPSELLVVKGDPGDDNTLVTFKHTADTANTNDTILDLQFSGDPSPGSARYISFEDQNSSNGYISDDNDGNISYNDTSDYRIKSDIQPVSGSLANINLLKPSSFLKRYKSKRAYGFIAHELQEVYPSMVNGEKDEVDSDGEMVIQTVAPTKLIPFIVQAIQELSAKVEALENAN